MTLAYIFAFALAVIVGFVLTVALRKLKAKYKSGDSWIIASKIDIE